MNKLKLLKYGLLALLVTSCNSGNNNSSQSTTPNQAANLSTYISKLNYVSVDGKSSSTLESKLNAGHKLQDFGRNGYQTSFYVPSPTKLTSIVTSYYNDTVCNNQVASTSFLGGVTMNAGMYHTSDASNYYLCSQYNYNGKTGCSGSLAGAQAGDYKSMIISYNFDNGTSTKSLCLYNQFNGTGYEAVANYTTPATPVACTASNCGYSQAYQTIDSSINTFALASGVSSGISYYLGESISNSLSGSGNPQYGIFDTPSVVPVVMSLDNVTAAQISTNTVFSCAIYALSPYNRPIYCWGSGGSGQIGNNATGNVLVATAVRMPTGVTAFSQISTNNQFSCAISSDLVNPDFNGILYCWGNGSNGKIGNNSTSNVSVPTSVQMPIGVKFDQISTNSNFSCAISRLDSSVTPGAAYCWGYGLNGQIGNSANLTVNVPTLVTMPSGVTAFSQISTSANASCALASTGNIYCWGSGTSGQIGNGANLNVNKPTLVTLPTGVTAFSQVSANGSFSCALASSGTNAGKVYCWGLGTSGQIGNGANLNANKPTLVVMPSGVTAFSKISTNGSFSCALASSGTDAGKVYCWGFGTSGQIGNGADLSVNKPTLATMPSGVTAFSQISTNSSFSCALASSGTNAGKVYCWGVGTGAQIGNDAILNVNVPTSITMPSGVTAFNEISTNGNFSCASASSGTNSGKAYCWGSSYDPNYLGGWVESVTKSIAMPLGVTAFSQISANSAFSCALSSGQISGRIYCWGLGTSGQIGNGANLTVKTPKLATMPTGVTAFSQVSTNSNFSCALASSGTNAGKVYCWGYGGSGQIGIGVNSSANVPTMVIMPSGVTAFSQVVANGNGGNFSCALASSGTDAGKVYCWGSGTSGQIGNGAYSNVNVPTSVTMPSGVTSFNQISISAYSSCAVASSGQIYCWGFGNSGQIGNGDNATVNVPTLVTMPSGVTAFSGVSSNGDSSCAVANSGTNAGKVYCWGLGTSGQIGNGVYTSSVNKPTSVTMPSGVTAFNQISASSNFSCALASSGTNAGKVYCWGAGTNGQIGNGVYANVNTPTSVTMPSGVTAFGKVWTSNGDFACAIAATGTNSGKRYCWGRNQYGQLGVGSIASSVSIPTLVK